MSTRFAVRASRVSEDFNQYEHADRDNDDQG